MGILRCFETTSESPVRIGAARDAAVPSSRTMDAGPSMRRVLSFESLTSGKYLPPRQSYSIWAIVGSLQTSWFLVMEKLGTGTSGLDRLLKGGFALRQINLVYGEASTGKTILAMQSALVASARGFKVFFVDADLSFSVQRLESLDRGGELAENIVVFQPEDFREQSRITESMEVMLSKTPALLIVDSVTGLYRADIEKPGTVFVQNRELNRQLAYLSDLASRFELTILLTGQVHSRPSGGSWLIAPVATRTLRHWSYLILRLRPTPRRDVRECLLEKIDGRDVRSSRALFRIGETGLEDV